MYTRRRTSCLNICRRHYHELSTYRRALLLLIPTFHITKETSGESTIRELTHSSSFSITRSVSSFLSLLLFTSDGHQRMFLVYCVFRCSGMRTGQMLSGLPSSASRTS
ncbi:hypothetical protein BDZ89DRAFT_33254 [Hymenopellis radicata]|nr:hypothetical protein BDZ89DRAFT_33254 [Hymenopellis radicata]